MTTKMASIINTNENIMSAKDSIHLTKTLFKHPIELLESDERNQFD